MSLGKTLAVALPVVCWVWLAAALWGAGAAAVALAAGVGGGLSHALYLHWTEP